jgi:hypothetical protein
MQQPRKTWVIEEAGQLLGTYYLKTNQGGPGQHVCNCGYMVAAEARGRGLATALCEHSQEQALALGYKAMQFNFVAATNTGAVRLWKKLGFAEVGRLPGAFNHPQQGYVDALVMYKWLDLFNDLKKGGAMTFKKHGISFGLERVDEEFILFIKAQGKLTHSDYATMVPLLESALKGVEKPHLKVLADLSEFEGWELRAAWDDLKLGLKHGSEFEKIAIYGHKSWQELAAKVGSWFVSGDVKSFDDYEQALTWLTEY